MDEFLRRRGARIGLVAVSVVAAISVGGGFVAAVVLVPALMVASRHASPVAAVGYGVLSATLAAETAWALTYVLVGEHQPYIWLLPVVVSALAGVVSSWVYRSKRIEEPMDSAPA